MSRSNARLRVVRDPETQECSRCGNEYGIDAIHVAPAGDMACWHCLRLDERVQILEELNNA